MVRKRLAALLILFILLGTVQPVRAENNYAENIASEISFSGRGYASFDFLSDGDIKTYQTSAGNVTVTLSGSQAFSRLYLLFDLEYGEYTVTDNVSGKSFTAGSSRFLHELVTLESPTTSVTLSFHNGSVRLSELYVFTEGALPDHVQQWDPPLEGKADIVLFATHSDDDQLFFAGLLPYYAAAVKCGVQVVYLTDHRNLTYVRTHEMLNGLWSVGVTAYPVFGGFADFRIDDLEKTYARYETLGTTKEDLQGFVVEQVRRFKPQVAVGHDLNGEYGHGMHMLYAELLVNALDITNDAALFPESAEKYGTWDIPKTYLHLYSQNPIEMDYDTPLEALNGMTAFAVSQKIGYPCHESQQPTRYTKWINWVDSVVDGTPITKATQITDYSPCKFGLYRSLVGKDIQKNDFLENIIPYAEQGRLAQEQLQLEQERREQEEQAAKERIIIAVSVLFVLISVPITAIMVTRTKKVRRKQGTDCKN